MRRAGSVSRPSALPAHRVDGGDRDSGLTTLKKRADYLRVRGGRQWSTASFLIETKAVAGDTTTLAEALPAPRFGFTVTKKLGGAVERNRIRRRLKEALRTGALDLAQPGFDYVVVARSAALARPFAAIVEDFRTALVRLHAAGSRPTDGKPRSRSPAGKTGPL